MPDELDLVVVGGGGHVGLPLALTFADLGLRVGICDSNPHRLESISQGRMPFLERGADEILGRVLAQGQLKFSSSYEIISRTSTVLLIIGTPLDEYLNPYIAIFSDVITELAPHLRAGSLLVLRSTIYPGTTEQVRAELERRQIDADVVFCPERIAEGHAMEELRKLPQVVGADAERGYQRAAKLFGRLGVELVRTTSREAELAKLFNNTWRYIKFAVANQFFEIARESGADYNRLLFAVRHEYPRGADIPAPGFAAGPCLLKDTMQLAAYATDHFPMGYAAMTINEGLPRFVLDHVELAHGPLRGRRLGILGTAFKGESDDPRDSLSYKLRKLALFRGADVLCCDPYVNDPRLVPESEVMAAAEIFVIGAPHQHYRELDFGGRPVADIWGLTSGGIRL